MLSPKKQTGNGLATVHTYTAGDCMATGILSWNSTVWVTFPQTIPTDYSWDVVAKVTFISLPLVSINASIFADGRQQLHTALLVAMISPFLDHHMNIVRPRHDQK